MQLEGSHFFITGGGSGLGAATARTLADAGASVFLADVDKDGAGKISEEVGSRAGYAYADVTEEVSVRRALDAAIEEFGDLHGVVNCAGIGPAARIVGKKGVHPLDTFTQVLTINAIGTFNVIRLAAQRVMEREPDASGERGVIVNTASVAAYDGQIGQAAYAASKGAIVSMTLPIARELAQSGIRVVTIAPGIFETPLLGTLPEESRDSLGKQVPFPPRLGRPDEYAALARHVIENEMLNGEVIRLDGAIRMAPK